LKLAAHTGDDAAAAGHKTPFALEAKAAAPARPAAPGLEAAQPAETAPLQAPNQAPAAAHTAPAAPQLEAAQLAALAVREHAAAAPRAHEAAPEANAVAAPAQQASLQIVQAASALPTDKLSGRVGTPAWDQQLGQKIVWMAAGGEQSATLTLNPPDLGPLQVVLNVSSTSTDASFTSAQPEVRQALEAAMPRLREMMSDAGIELGQATVSSDSGGQRDGGAGQSGRGARGNGAAGAQGTDGTVARASAPRRGLLGAVDTFA
jgi:flagellar hook-length control protein FliK